MLWRVRQARCWPQPHIRDVPFSVTLHSQPNRSLRSCGGDSAVSPSSESLISVSSSSRPLARPLRPTTPHNLIAPTFFVPSLCDLDFGHFRCFLKRANGPPGPPRGVPWKTHFIRRETAHTGHSLETRAFACPMIVERTCTHSYVQLQASRRSSCWDGVSQ